MSTRRFLPMILIILSITTIIFVNMLSTQQNVNMQLVGHISAYDIILVFNIMYYIYSSYKNKNDSTKATGVQSLPVNIMLTTMAILIILSPILLIWYR